MTTTALEHAANAWDAVRAPNPTGLGDIASHSSGELRFVGEAFDRLGRAYPSVRDGLSLTERRILAAVADGATRLTKPSYGARLGRRDRFSATARSDGIDRLSHDLTAHHEAGPMVA